jgi:hypothetical protein
MSVRQIRAGMGFWNPKIIEEHFAPGIGSFTSASIPDLSLEFPQADHWVANHLLNSIFRGTFTDPHRQYAINLLFRSRAAFRAYATARKNTFDYLSKSQPTRPNTGLYCDALEAWERFLYNWAACVRIVKSLGKGDVFTPGDGSIEQRAYDLSNTMKHWAEKSVFASGDTIPVWLSNEGLNSSNLALTYGELGELARDMAKLADEVQDPVGMKERAEGDRSQNDGT